MKFALAALGLLMGSQLHASEIQRLDASVTSSVLTSGSGTVTNWIDQTGSGFNAVPAVGSVTYPTLFPNNLEGLSFGPTRSSLSLFSSAASDQWLNQSAGTGGFCVLVAFKVDSLIQEWNDLIGNSSAAGSGFGMRYFSNGNMVAYLGGVSLQKLNDLKVAAGDTFVFAFNYSAVLDRAEFWDSKNYGSMFATVANADFSNNSAVTLGSMGSSTRFFDGIVGEVKVFNHALSAADFKAEREALAEKWADIAAPVQVQWRVIPEDPAYPEDEAVVAGIVIGDPGFIDPLPADPANADCTATFQEALDSMAAAGGGTVFVPAGHYRFDGNLEIPEGVTLRGRWKAPSSTQPVIGTVLKVYTGQGSTAGPAFLSGVGVDCGIRNLAFWYPEQSPASFVAYPYTVANVKDAMKTIENITLVNSYLGLDLSKSAFQCLRGVYGTPLSLGFWIDNGYAVPRFDSVYLSPNYWAWSGLAGSPSVGGPHATQMLASAIGIDIGRIDGGYFQKITIDGCLYGIRFRKNTVGDFAGGNEFYDVKVTNCSEALRLDAVNGFRAFKSTFTGNVYGVHRIAEQAGNYYGCTISGSTAALMGEAGGRLYTVSMQDCSMGGKVNLASMASLQLVNSPFTTTGTNIILNTGVAQAVVAGCTNGGPANILDNSGSSLIVVSTDPVASDPLPTFPPTYTKTRKPDKLDLLLVTNPVFAGGAKGDAATDDTAAIQAAIAAANSNGGGIVFFPAGGYRVTGTLSLGVGAAHGVELRGIFGGRHTNTLLGSTLLIDTGAGNANGTPFITLNDHSGVRGLNFEYASQNWRVSEQIPYPYMIRAQGGALNYVIDCCVGNVYQAVDFNNVRQGLVDYCFFGGIANTYLVRGGSNLCRIQNTHVKPMEWWLTNKPPGNAEGALELAQNALPFIVEQCTNLSIYGVFNHAAHTLFTQRGGAGVALFLGGETLQRGFVMETAPASGTFAFIGGDTNINIPGDGSYAWWLKETFNGSVTAWGNQVLTTGCDYLICVDGTNASFTANGMTTGQRRGLAGIVATGTVNLKNVTLADRFSLDVLSGGAFNASCSLLPPMSNETQLGATSYTNCLIPNSYIAADANEDLYCPIGMSMDTATTEPIEVAIFPVVGQTRPTTEPMFLKTGWHLKSGSTSFSFDVTDPEFTDGSNPSVKIEISYLEDTNGSITVACDTANGMVNKATYNLSASTAAWKTQIITLTDARFAAADGRDITITTSGGADPVLLYVVVQSAYLGAP